MPVDAVRTATFPARLESLRAISDLVTRAARAAELDENAIYAVDMAVDEACANIIAHAYGEEGLGEIEITYRIDGDGLTLSLRDLGRPFDPTRVPQPDLDSPLEARSAGGLGLYLMRKLMDRVEFESSPDAGNVLTLVKLREPAS